MLEVLPPARRRPRATGKKDRWTASCGAAAARASRRGRPIRGPGRPGWHVECTAIAQEHLGGAFDVGGSSDLVFPTTDVIAGHAQVAVPGTPFARSTATGMVAYDGEKMSKSRGNLVFVSALRNSDVDPMAIRPRC